MLLIMSFFYKKIKSLSHIFCTTVGKVLRIYRKWGVLVILSVGCVSDPFSGLSGRRKLLDADDMRYAILIFANSIEY